MEPYIKIERVLSLQFPDLVTCALCNGLLWTPIACSNENCQTPYCTLCVKNWQANSSHLDIIFNND